jgi:hypothetical protein
VNIRHAVCNELRHSPVVQAVKARRQQRHDAGGCRRGGHSVCARSGSPTDEEHRQRWRTTQSSFVPFFFVLGDRRQSRRRSVTASSFSSAHCPACSNSRVKHAEGTGFRYQDGVTLGGGRNTASSSDSRCKHWAPRWRSCSCKLGCRTHSAVPRREFGQPGHLPSGVHAAERAGNR